MQQSLYLRNNNAPAHAQIMPHVYAKILIICASTFSLVTMSACAEAEQVGSTSRDLPPLLSPFVVIVLVATPCNYKVNIKFV